MTANSAQGLFFGMEVDKYLNSPYKAPPAAPQQPARARRRAAPRWRAAAGRPPAAAAAAAALVPVRAAGWTGATALAAPG